MIEFGDCSFWDIIEMIAIEWSLAYVSYSRGVTAYLARREDGGKGRLRIGDA